MPDKGEAKAAIIAQIEFEIQERLIKRSKLSKKPDSKYELSTIQFRKLKKKPGYNWLVLMVLQSPSREESLGVTNREPPIETRILP